MVDGVSVLMAKRVVSPDKRTARSHNQIVENVKDKVAKKVIEDKRLQNNFVDERKENDAFSFMEQQPGVNYPPAAAR